MNSLGLHTQKREQGAPRGQGLVEFVLVLPFLLLLAIGMMEAGYAMYHYLLLANANREGVRLAARGRFGDEEIINRVVGAGGTREVDGVETPNLQLGENFGVIITHIPFPPDPAGNWQAMINVTNCCQPDPDNCPEPNENNIEITICLAGSITENNGDEPRPIDVLDSSIEDIGAYQDNVDITALINELRADADYDEKSNEVVIVETFLAHPMLLHFPDYFPLPDPFTLYFMSTMRVSLNSRM